MAKQRNWSPSRLAALAKSRDVIQRASARAALVQIKEDVKLVRKYYVGYEDIDLRSPGNISARLLRTIRKKLSVIRPTLASCHVNIRAPKTKAAREALAKFVDRPIPRDARMVPVGVGPNTKVKIVTRGKRASVRTERTVSLGSVWQEQSWYFADYTEDEFDLDTEYGVSATYENMIKSGDLPRDGWFVLLTGSYGPVGAPNTLYAMQEVMARMFLRYETEHGKVGQFIGVRLVGFSGAEADREYQPRLAAQVARKRQREALRRQLRRLRARR